MDIKSIILTITSPKRIKEKKTLQNVKPKIQKKRVECANWNIDDAFFKYERQMSNLKNVQHNNYKSTNYFEKLTLQQISKKIIGYKQQDLHKKIYNPNMFLNLKCVIDKIIECELKCYYCTCEMNLLYDISREMKQWTVDRINNDLGHNIDNFFLACLECNLKRRRRNDEKFLFTKQLKIVKINTSQENNKDLSEENNEDFAEENKEDFAEENKEDFAEENKEK